MFVSYLPSSKNSKAQKLISFKSTKTSVKYMNMGQLPEEERRNLLSYRENRMENSGKFVVIIYSIVNNFFGLNHCRTKRKSPD